MRTGHYDKNGTEICVGDIVHFRCKNASLSGKGVVFLTDTPDGLSSDPFRIKDTREGKSNGRIYPWYENTIYRIDERSK